MENKKEAVNTYEETYTNTKERNAETNPLLLTEKVPAPQRKSSKGNGKIAGQGTKKDSVTTLLFKTNNDNFAELFNRTILKDAPIEADELVEEDIKETAFLRITKEGGGTTLVQYRDVVKGTDNGKVLAILGIENQSETDPSMPYRVVELDFVNYARQVQMIREKHNKEWTDADGHIHRPENVSKAEFFARFLETDKIEKCMTLVVYWGEKPWKGAMKFSDLFAGGMDGAHTIQTELNLVDVCRMTDEEICSYTSELRTVFGFLKYAKDKDKLSAFINENKAYYSNVSETALNALDELTHSPELQEIRTPKYQREGEIDVCEGIRGMIEDGKKEILFDLVKDGVLAVADAAKRAGMNAEDFEEAYKKYVKKE